MYGKKQLNVLMCSSMMFVMLALTGCGAHTNLAGTNSNASGSVTAKVVWGEGKTTAKTVTLPTGLANIQVTVTGTDGAGKAIPVVRGTLPADTTQGTINNVYPGTVTLAAKALNANGATVYEGFAVGVVVNAGSNSAGTIVMSAPMEKGQDTACIQCHETTLDGTGQNLVADFKQSGHYTNQSWSNSPKDGITGTGCAGCHGPSHNDVNPSASGRCWECHGAALEGNHQNNGAATTNCVSCHQAHNANNALPPVPTNLTATTASSSEIDLSWINHATNATGLIIQRKSGPDGTYVQVGTAAANATSYKDTGLPSGTSYFYRIMAVNSTGVSAYSTVSFSVINAVPVSYTITDLGTFGGTTNYVTGINNAGQAVGYSYSYSFNGGTRTQAWLYSNGNMTALGTLGGTNSQALGINSAGLVVGTSNIAGDMYSHAFLYSNGAMTDLGTLGGSNSTAASINDAGQIVGDSYSSIRDQYGNPEDHAFLYANGTMSDLGTLGGDNSDARGINNAGQIVGSSYTTSNYGRQAYVYSNGTMNFIGQLGVATGINNVGQVVGGQSHAFLYSNGTIADLGTLGGASSAAYGINSRGQIVGTANGSGPGAGFPQAFFYNNGTMTTLAGTHLSDGGYLQSATGINDAGQIIAMDSIGHAYILTPVY